MADCRNLDPDSHDLLAILARTRAGKTGLIKTTVQKLRDQTGIPYRDVQLLLEDLTSNGFLEYDKATGNMFRGPLCRCEELLEHDFVHDPRSEPLGSAADDDGPTQRSGGGESEEALKGTDSTGGAKERAGGPSRAHKAPSRPRRVVRRPKRGIDWFVANPTELQPRVLARYFEERMDEVRTTKVGFRSVGLTNLGALQGSFARWVRDDAVSPIQIVAMIDIFARDTSLLREGVGAWKIFLANRELLVSRAVRLVENHEDPENWNRHLEDEVDETLGWG